jgi:L-lactate dehydrogenase complex protein LldG
MATEVSAARTEVLRRVRAALGQRTAVEAEAVRTEWELLPRTYQRAATLGREEVLDMLEDRLRDYDAHVERAKPSEIGAAIGRLLAGRATRRLLIPDGFAQVLSDQFAQVMPAGFEFVTDSDLLADHIDTLDGVLTTAQVAIAATGTIVVQNVPGQGRRAATLIPDYHLCLVRVEDVVQTVPEAMDRLAETSTLATTFISGPSATADIEMTRIKGVHGPRFLDVILVL